MWSATPSIVTTGIVAAHRSPPARPVHDGVVSSRPGVGPADSPGGQVAKERLTADLTEAQAKLDKQRNAVKATERRIAGLARELEEPGGEPA